MYVGGGVVQKFIEAGRSIGVDLVDVTPTTGSIPHRTKLIGNGNGKDGWYYLNIINDIPVGVVGNWKTGERVEVKSSGGFDGISKAELVAMRVLRAEAEKEQKRVMLEASQNATEYFKSLPDCPDDHPYLKTKGIQPLCAKYDEEDGSLVIPIYDIDAKQTSWQKIWDKSQKGGRGKLFLKGGQKKGCFCHIKGQNPSPTYIAEGFATAASIHQATDCSVFVAFDAGNLAPVYQQLNLYFNGRTDLVVAADNDHKKEKNVGLDKAREIGCKVVFPTGIDGSDFNDMHQELGIVALTEALIPNQLNLYQTATDISTDDLSLSLPTVPDGLFRSGMDGMLGEGMPSIGQYAFPVIATILSRVIAGKITCADVWPNIYTVKVGPTSSGKTESDKELVKYLRRVGLADLIGLTDVASGPGLYRAISEEPVTLFVLDEATSIFRKYDNRDPIADGKRDALMDLFSKSGEFVKKHYGNSKSSIEIDRPCLSFIGNATPLIFESISCEDFVSGLIPRFDFFCYDGEVPYRGVKSETNKSLERFINGIRLLHTSMPPTGSGNLSGVLTPHEIGFTAEAKAMVEDFSRTITDAINSLDTGSTHHGIISRKYHGAIKYALIHIAGTRRPEDIYKPMDIDSLAWGISVVNKLADWKTGVLEKKIVSGDFHRDCEMFLEAATLATKASQRPTYSVLANRKKDLHNWKPQYSGEVISVLVKRGDIVLDESKRKTAYFLPKKST